MMLKDSPPRTRTGTCPNGSRLVLGLGRSGSTAALMEHFVRMGWNVTAPMEESETDRETHRLAEGFVVLQVQQGGLLSAAKLRLTRPNVRVVLLGCESPEQIRDAEFVGAIPMRDASGLLDPSWALPA